MVGSMSDPISVKEALASSTPRDSIFVQGWVRTRRDAKSFSFLELNDGSCLKNLQVIAGATLPNYAEIQRLNTGASVAVRGRLIASQGKGQSWEVTAEAIDIVGPADATYPLQKKGHTPEFLREIAHLRPLGWPRGLPSSRFCRGRSVMRSRSSLTTSGARSAMYLRFE